MSLITAKLANAYPVLVELVVPTLANDDGMSTRQPAALLLRVRDESKRENVLVELAFDPIDAAGLMAEINTVLTGSIFGR